MKQGRWQAGLHDRVFPLLNRVASGTPTLDSGGCSCQEDQPVVPFLFSSRHNSYFDNIIRLFTEPATPGVYLFGAMELNDEKPSNGSTLPVGKSAPTGACTVARRLEK